MSPILSGWSIVRHVSRPHEHTKPHGHSTPRIRKATSVSGALARSPPWPAPPIAPSASQSLAHAPPQWPPTAPTQPTLRGPNAEGYARWPTLSGKTPRPLNCPKVGGGEARAIADSNEGILWRGWQRGGGQRGQNESRAWKKATLPSTSSWRASNAARALSACAVHR